MQNSLHVAAFLTELGFYPQHSGFGYLTWSITMILISPMDYYSGRVDIIKTLTQEFEVPVSRVRRNMKYSICAAWGDKNNTGLRSLFPACSEQYPPSIYEFLCRAAIEFCKRMVITQN